MKEAIQNKLQKNIKSKVLVDEMMSAHTTFKVGGPADFFVAPAADEVATLLENAKELDLPVTVIGNGSNLLVGDKGIRGLTICIGKNMSNIKVSGNQIFAEAGASLAQIAQAAASVGLGGFEFAAGIPGYLGGAVIMNAGAYGGQMEDVLIDATVLLDGKVVTYTKDELELGYRHSALMGTDAIVLSANIELLPKPEDEIREEMKRLREARLEKQPLEFASAGSTFKRPEGYFAGKLIEDAGLRGFSLGTPAFVSEKHCGFVVNKGGATAKDIADLITEVVRIVKEDSGITLETEVRYLGEFE